MNVLRYLRMVLWSFFGIRRRAGAEVELAQARPVPLLLTAIGAAACFVVLLLSIAAIAAGSAG